MVEDEVMPMIAWLGTGLMGAPMAKRLLAAGFKLSAWNRTISKAQALVGNGATIAPSPQEAVRDADIIITMLEAGPAVQSVLHAALPAIRSGALVVDMSSTRQSEAVELAAMLKQYGIDCMDAPVSGGVLGAEAGTLAIMAGGADRDFEKMGKVFSALGNATLVGPVGCGQLAKLCNQMIVGGTLAIVAEALVLAEAGGADPRAVRAALRGGFAESRILEVHGQRMLDRRFEPGGKVASQLKDLDNALHAAEAAGITLPLTEMTTEQFRALIPDLAVADQSAILLGIEKLNKLEQKR